MAKIPKIDSSQDYIDISDRPDNSFWRSVGEAVKDLEEQKLWKAIQQETKNNVVLQAEFERLKTIYFLIKENKTNKG